MGHQKVSVAHISYFWIAKTPKAGFFCWQQYQQCQEPYCVVSQKQSCTHRTVWNVDFLHRIAFCIASHSVTGAGQLHLIWFAMCAAPLRGLLKLHGGSHIALVQCQWRWMTAQKQSRLPLFGRCNPLHWSRTENGIQQTKVCSTREVSVLFILC